MTTNTIMFVAQSLNRGGTEQHLAAVLPRLNRDFIEAEIFLLVEAGELANDLSAQGIVIHKPWIKIEDGIKRNLAFRIFRLGLVFIQLWLCLIRRKPAIVHFFLPVSYLIGAPVSMLANVPVRILSRRSLNNYQHSFFASRWLERTLFPSLHAVLGNSRSVLQQLVYDECVPVEKTGLIYNGVDLNQFNVRLDLGSLADSVGIKGDCLVLVIVANLIPYKGHSDLIAALNDVKDLFRQDWRLLVVGRDGEYGDTLKSSVAAMGLSENIIFTGMRADVPELLALSDVGILASHQEGFANAILEYMAAGLPVVATDVGGNAEAVEHGKTGLIVPVAAPTALGEAIVRLAKDPELRSRMGAAGRARAAEEFSLDRCVGVYESVYRTLLTGGSISDIPEIPARDHKL